MAETLRRIQSTAGVTRSLISLPVEALRPSTTFMPPG